MIPRVDVERGAAAWPSRAIVRALARRVRRAARAMGCSRAELDALELRLVDDARMRVIKAQSFGVAEATDVLSFPAGESIPGLDDGASASLGEVVLNRDAVARQATRPGPAGWLDEATSLAIHGVAHLRGHDHDVHTRARRMLACEQRGSRAVGLPCARPYGGATAAPAAAVVRPPATTVFEVPTDADEPHDAPEPDEMPEPDDGDDDA